MKTDGGKQKNPRNHTKQTPQLTLIHELVKGGKIQSPISNRKRIKSLKIRQTLVKQKPTYRGFHRPDGNRFKTCCTDFLSEPLLEDTQCSKLRSPTHEMMVEAVKVS